MNTKLEEIDGKYVAMLEGEMDTAAAIGAQVVLKQLYKNDGKEVIIDCCRLEYISSTGLGIMVRILKAAKAAGSKVVMRGANDDIKKIFKMTGFLTAFEFVE